MSTVGVIGAGSWGTALAVTLGLNGHDVRLYARNEEQLASLRKTRENLKYLPGVKLPETITLTGEISDAVSGAEAVCFSTPAQSFRSVLSSSLEYIDDEMIIINVAKGIEKNSLMRLSEIAASFGIEEKYCMLSGPSHAEEVGQKMMTALVAASVSEETAVAVQNMFSTDFLRVYTGSDVTGCELGGALKNIIALGAGITDGMGFGDNSKAALMTRGIAEMKRLGAALGADPATFAGLTGIGDLIVTCTSMHSRNRRCGILIGKGMNPQDAVKEVGMVVEGMFTAEAAYELAGKAGVEMPITSAIYRLVKGDVSAEDAVKALMARDLKPED